MIKYWFVLLFTLLLFSCRRDVIKPGVFYQLFNVKQEQVSLDSSLQFLVVGDWGRNGSYGQVQVAEQMAKSAHLIQPEFIISTGDNFYPSGVESVNDPQWKTSFENIYTDSVLFCDWYHVLGNHDYLGSVQAQIDYSEESARWKLPDWYYSFERTLADDTTKVLFVFTDTNPIQYTGFQARVYSKTRVQNVVAQLEWLQNTLEESDAHWKIVIGHHPVYTGGRRKKQTKPMKKAFRDMFKEQEVDLYLCGHEHDMQLLKEKDRKTTYIVSGAGSKIRDTGKMKHTEFAAAENGFFINSVTPDSIYIQAVDTLNNVMFDYVVKK